jgi:hypothetical protein
MGTFREGFLEVATLGRISRREGRRHANIRKAFLLLGARNRFFSVVKKGPGSPKTGQNTQSWAGHCVPELYAVDCKKSVVGFKAW